MMVFTVCVNDTVQLLYISIIFLVEKYLRGALIDHVWHITVVMIFGCQCITMIQNR